MGPTGTAPRDAAPWQRQIPLTSLVYCLLTGLSTSSPSQALQCATYNWISTGPMGQSQQFPLPSPSTRSSSPSQPPASIPLTITFCRGLVPPCSYSVPPPTSLLCPSQSQGTVPFTCCPHLLQLNRLGAGDTGGFQTEHNGILHPHTPHSTWDKGQGGGKRRDQSQVGSRRAMSLLQCDWAASPCSGREQQGTVTGGPSSSQPQVQGPPQPPAMWALV